MRKLYIYGLMIVGLAACKPNIEPNAPERGDADFSQYLAVGNSTTAGYMDGSLYRSGQQNSFPKMLADQFKSVGGGNFLQPLMPGEHGWPRAKKILDYYQGPCDTIPSLAPVDFKGALDTVGTINNVFNAGPYNNMGIPGIRVIDHLLPGYGMLNPYARRLYENPATARPLDELLNLNHTFFTLWLGANDVLGYATAGGVQQGNPLSIITTNVPFKTAYDSVLNTVTRNGAKGVVLTVPDVLTLPYFTTIPANGLVLEADDANRLNLAYNGTQVHFDEGPNFFVVEDSNAAGGFRQIKANELVRLELPMDSVKCAGWGTIKPIPAGYFLDESEIAYIRNAVGDYNAIIVNLANEYKIPVADVNSYLKTIAQEGKTQYNGVSYSLKFVSGGAFSLDGIHLTGRGNALIANLIISTINQYYGSSIHSVDVNSYSGVRIP